jgi:hypothetical protein
VSSYETQSEVDGLGRVVFCRGCEEVYVCIGHASYRMPLMAFRELGRMIDAAVNHQALNPEGPPQRRFSILDGGLRLDPTVGH